MHCGKVDMWENTAIIIANRTLLKIFLKDAHIFTAGRNMNVRVFRRI